MHNHVDQVVLDHHARVYSMLLVFRCYLSYVIIVYICCLSQYFQSVFDQSMASLGTIIPVLTIFFCLLSFSEGRQFLVGGNENSWSSPPSSDSLNQWADQKNRFNAGDFLSNISSHLASILLFS